MSVEKTLKDRQSMHGNFKENAEVSQCLKDIISPWEAESPKLDRPAYMNEGLDAICEKLARIVVGNPMEPDHWHDIQGYARLVEKELLTGDLEVRNYIAEEARPKTGVIRENTQELE